MLYDANPPKWDDISNLSGVLGWTEVTNTTTLRHYLAQGVSEKYIYEMVEAATRVNYGQVMYHIFNNFNIDSLIKVDRTLMKYTPWKALVPWRPVVLVVLQAGISKSLSSS